MACGWHAPSLYISPFVLVGKLYDYRLKMASSHIESLVVFVVIGMVTLIIPVNANLSPHFYDKVCPKALPVIRSVVQRAINREPRIGASLLRLHFHDCFVNVSINILNNNVYLRF